MGALLAAAGPGLLVGSFLVACWEFQDLVLRTRPRLWASLFLATVPPAGLAVLPHSQPPIPVPWPAVWLAALPYALLDPPPAARWAIGPALAAAAWLGSPAPGLSPLPGALLLGSGGIATVLLGAAPRLRATPAGRVGLALGGAGILAGSLIAARAAASVLAPIAALAGTLGAYVVFQTRRTAYWTTQQDRADHDALTGCLTRHGLARWQAAHPGATGLIAFLDLDAFKAVNDSYGHLVGDRVLQAVAARLQAAAPPDAACVRWGGDEFTVWLPGVPAATAPDWIRRLHDAVTRLPYPVGDAPVVLGAALGWAVGPLTLDTVAAADHACLQAQRAGGRGCYPAVTPDAPGPAPPLAPDVAPLVHAAEALWAAWSVPAVLTDPAGRILTANPAFEAATGRALAAWIGQPAPDHLTPPLPVRAGRRLLAQWRLGLGWTTAPLPWRWEDLHLTAVFQPVIALRDGALIGWEALLRPAAGGTPLPPAVFFAALAGHPDEARYDVAAVTAIATAVAAAGLPPDGVLFVNIRPATLADPAAFTAARTTLHRVVPPDRVVWEVGEQTRGATLAWPALPTQWPDAVWAQDDVGAGEADLVRLVELRPTWVKVDQRLVQALPTHPAAAGLVQALVAWAHRAGGRVIGEGVETAEQAAALAATGADAGQGFYWARPGPPWPHPAATPVPCPAPAAP